MIEALASLHMVDRKYIYINIYICKDIYIYTHIHDYILQMLKAVASLHMENREYICIYIYTYIYINKYT